MSNLLEKDLNDAIELKNNIILVYDCIDDIYLDRFSNQKILNLKRDFLTHYITFHKFYNIEKDESYFIDLIQKMNEVS
jgi:hypothetical protein